MNKENEMPTKPKPCALKVIIPLLAGVILGVLITSAAFVKLMPAAMIVTNECTLPFDDTIDALEKTIPANGWVLSGIKDMNKSLAKQGVKLEPKVKLVELCKPDYSKSVLTTDRYIATMMPCTFAVWEADDGKVYLSKINMGLMAKLFGGNVAKIMGQNVVVDEEKILAGLLKEK